jgi:hypothetical protein
MQYLTPMRLTSGDQACICYTSIHLHVKSVSFLCIIHLRFLRIFPLKWQYRCSEWYSMLTTSVKILFAKATDQAPELRAVKCRIAQKEENVCSIIRSVVVCLAISRMETGDLVKTLSVTGLRASIRLAVIHFVLAKGRSKFKICLPLPPSQKPWPFFPTRTE